MNFSIVLVGGVRFLCLCGSISRIVVQYASGINRGSYSAPAVCVIELVA